MRFTALLHHITVDLLVQSYCALERDSAPGINGVTWQAYGENLEVVEREALEASRNFIRRRAILK